MRWYRRLALVLILGSTVDASAQTRTLDPVVVTPTMTETPLERLGASVTVVPGEEIEQKNFSTLTDALRQVPGVDIQRSGGVGKTSAIRIRGANEQQVQVMIDGLRVKSPTLGQAELTDISLDAIDRIEIVRGPQSTLHGADAIGGVVNIITKKGQGPPALAVRLEAGNFATYREQAALSGSWKAFSYMLSGSRFDTNGYLRNDDARQSAFAGRFDYAFPWDGTLTFSGRYSNTITDLPIFSTDPTVFDPNSRQQSETLLFNIIYGQKITDWWQTRVRWGQWQNSNGFQNPDPPGDFTIVSQITTQRQEAEWLNTFQVGPWDTLTVGVERRYEYGKSRHTFREEINVISGFAQNELRLWDRVILGGGVRYEDNDVFGDALTGRASIAVLFPETGTKLRAAWGEGFRAPTINDLFFPGFGNPNVKPERSESWEVGVDQRLWDNRVRFGITYFHNDFTDLIQFVQQPGFIFIPENVGKARTEGVEFYSEFIPVDWLSVYANYTYTDSEDLETRKPLRRIPKHRWAVGTSFTWDRLQLFADALVVSRQFETPFANTGRNYNDGYFRIDLGGSYKIWGRAWFMERIDLIARFNNITDERYDEVQGFPAPPFNAMIGVRVAFQ